MEKACIHLYIGNGRGKTCSAIGLAIRAAGHRKKAVIFHFLKSGTSGEDLFIRAYAPEYLKVCTCEREHGFYPFLEEEEQLLVKNEQHTTLKRVKASIISGVFIIVLDEIIDSINNGIISYNDFFEIIELAKKYNTELVLTGRDPIDKIVELSDYVTEFNSIKHPFEKLQKARDGIEY